MAIIEFSCIDHTSDTFPTLLESTLCDTTYVQLLIQT